jgi:hypothetical protein
MPAGDPSPFTIGASRTLIGDDQGRAAESFARRSAFHCAGALDPAFMAMLSKICQRAQFAPDVVDKVGHRELETPNIAGAALTLALKRASLMRWIEDATGCGPLDSIGGRVARMRPGADDHLAWHNDLNEPGRRLAITINLSRQPYEGGEFELRAVATGEVLLRHKHDEPGSALVFDVSPRLEHRVLPVTAGGPRLVYAGWFTRGKKA